MARRRKTSALPFDFRQVVTTVEFKAIKVREKEGMSLSECQKLSIKIALHFIGLGYSNQILEKRFRSLYHPCTGKRLYLEFVPSGQGFRKLPIPFKPIDA